MKRRVPATVQARPCPPCLARAVRRELALLRRDGSERPIEGVSECDHRGEQLGREVDRAATFELSQRFGELVAEMREIKACLVEFVSVHRDTVGPDGGERR